MTVQSHFQSLDDGQALADSNHLFEGGLDLTLEQIDILSSNPLKLRLKLVVESRYAIDLPKRFGFLGDVLVKTGNICRQILQVILHLILQSEFYSFRALVLKGVGVQLRRYSQACSKYRAIV